VFVSTTKSIQSAAMAGRETELDVPVAKRIHSPSGEESNSVARMLAGASNSHSDDAVLLSQSNFFFTTRKPEIPSMPPWKK